MFMTVVLAEAGAAEGVGDGHAAAGTGGERDVRAGVPAGMTPTLNVLTLSMLVAPAPEAELEMGHAAGSTVREGHVDLNGAGGDRGVRRTA